jgi:hypothetical protein
MTGSAVAVTNKRALTALHGYANLESKIDLRTRRGTNLKGIVEFVLFSRDLVDIAVILLDDGNFFENFIPWSEEPVALTQNVTVVGLKFSRNNDEVVPYARKTSVDMIEGGDSTLFQAQYYNFDGCSGTGVVTSLLNGVFAVVGVHIASHDDKLKPESSKKKKRTLSELEASIASDLHGYTAYSLVCEIARVPKLVAHLKQYQ